MGLPTVGVCVPTRNRANYLAQSLQSILDQTRMPDRVVISDDGSADSTGDVVVEYAARFAAAGVEVRTFRHDAPLGQAGNRRFAFRQAQCDYLAMLDDDDLWRPRFLEALVPALDDEPPAGFASCGLELIDGDGCVIRDLTTYTETHSGRAAMAGLYPDTLAYTLARFPFMLQNTLFRRAALEGVGYVPKGDWMMPDYVLFAHLGVGNVGAIFVPEALGTWRLHHCGPRASDDPLATAYAHRDIVRGVLADCTDERHQQTLAGQALRRQRELALELAHAGRRRAAVAEAVALIRSVGLARAGHRIWLNLPLVLLGADHLRAGRARPNAPHALT